MTTKARTKVWHLDNGGLTFCGLLINHSTMLASERSKATCSRCIQGYRSKLRAVR